MPRRRRCRAAAQILGLHTGRQSTVMTRCGIRLSEGQISRIRFRVHARAGPWRQLSFRGGAATVLRLKAAVLKVQLAQAVRRAAHRVERRIRLCGRLMVCEYTSRWMLIICWKLCH